MTLVRLPRSFSRFHSSKGQHISIEDAKSISSSCLASPVSGSSSPAASPGCASNYSFTFSEDASDSSEIIDLYDSKDFTYLNFIEKCLFLEHLISELGEKHGAEVVLRIETDNDAWLAHCDHLKSTWRESTCSQRPRANTGMEMYGGKDESLRNKAIKTSREMLHWLDQS